MVSVCIIVKNEEVNIKHCLNAIKKLGYEIVVVDTGSLDNTKSVALEYTDKVYDFAWCDDFSAARNYAISKVSNDYILMVDSDEFLIDFKKQELEKLIIAHQTSVGRIHRNNLFLRNGMEYCSKELVNRVFPKKYYHYEGNIHEQIVANSNESYLTYEVPLTFEHTGYNGNAEDRMKKAMRNIQLLLKMLEERGEEPYTLYQLGKGYYFAEDYENAVRYFSKALEFDLNTKLEYVIDMVEMYGYSLMNSSQMEFALNMKNIYQEFSHSADFVFMMGFIYMNNEMYQEAIAEFIKASKFKESKVLGVNSYLALYNIGVIYECLGKKQNAVHYYKQCKAYKPAQLGIERCK